MTIRETIEELQQSENLDAKLIITFGNEDHDIISTTDFSIFSDLSEEDYREIYIDEESCKKQV